MMQLSRFGLIYENTGILLGLAGMEVENMPSSEYGLLLLQNQALTTIRDNGGTGECGPGVPGKSAYQIAVDNGFVGTVEEWLVSLEGEDGADAVMPTRQTLTHTTASLAAGASETFTLELPRTFTLISVGVSSDAFTRAYLTTAARAADAARNHGTPPPDAVYYGLAFDLNLPDKGALSVPVGEDFSLNPEGELYMSIRNTDSSAAAITLTLEYLGREA